MTSAKTLLTLAAAALCVLAAHPIPAAAGDWRTEYPEIQSLIHI